MSEPLTITELFAIQHRGEAPSRQSAAQVRADYTALAGEVNRLRRERHNLRIDLARLALGETTAAELLAGLDLGREIRQVRETNAANAAFHAQLVRDLDPEGPGW